MTKDISLIIVGALIALASTLFLDHKKRAREKSEQRDRARQLLKAIIEEVKMGISRCAGLSKRLDDNPPSISFSRVYTALWDSTLPELSKTINNLEILRLLNSTYYYFDLVNFNMNRNEFAVGAAFAKDKLTYLQENLSKLEIRLNEIPDKVLFNTPVLDRIVVMVGRFLKSVFYRKS